MTLILTACRDTLEPRLLAAAPELATLALLDDVLVVCKCALFAEHPTLSHELRSDPESRSLREARRLLDATDRAHRAVARYRAAVLDSLAPPPDEDRLPF